MKRSPIQKYWCVILTIVGFLLFSFFCIIILNTKTTHARSFMSKLRTIHQSIAEPMRQSLFESRWPPNKLVVVPAVWKEIDWSNRSSWPVWLRVGLNMTENHSAEYHIHLYQRIDAESRPPYDWPYCENSHEEAGVYLQFIYDYYYDLPEKMLFLHGEPFSHSPSPIEAALCVRDDVHYTSVNNGWVQDRPWSFLGRDQVDNVSLMYKCANRLLKLFGYDGELQLNPTNHTPKDDSLISTYCCAQFFVTKQRIRHYTYEQWVSLYDASHEPFCTTERDHEHAGRMDMKWFGGSFEHIWHVILGLHATNMPTPIQGTNTDRCHIFRASCQGSLCLSHTT